MTTVMVPMNVPEGMAPYLNSINDSESVFARNAMLLYPFIKNMTISHGRAAEILGVRKTDLIGFYDSMGISYLNQSRQDLVNDIQTLDKVLKAAK
jgi:hypothetical protein